MSTIHRINAIIAYKNGQVANYSNVFDGINYFEISHLNYDETENELFSWPSFRNFIENIDSIDLADPINISHINDIAWSVDIEDGSGHVLISGYSVRNGYATNSNAIYNPNQFNSISDLITEQSEMPFEPTSINSLLSWFNPTNANNPINNADVISVTDPAGGNNWLEKYPGAPLHPQYKTNVLNGRPGIFIDRSAGRRGFKKLINPLASTDLTTMSVFAMTDNQESFTTLTAINLSTAGNANLFDFRIKGSSSNSAELLSRRDGTTYNILTGDPLTVGQIYLVTCIGKPGSQILRINGNVIDTGTSANWDSPLSDVLGIGVQVDAGNDVGTRFDGYLGDNLFFAEALNGSSLNEMEQYLANKYSITLN